jgi:hypothetical protein
MLTLECRHARISALDHQLTLPHRFSIAFRRLLSHLYDCCSGQTACVSRFLLQWIPMHLAPRVGTLVAKATTVRDALYLSMICRRALSMPMRFFAKQKVFQSANDCTFCIRCSVINQEPCTTTLYVTCTRVTLTI